MDSTRFPGKVLMKVDKNKTVLHYVIEQIQYSKLIDNIIVVTTVQANDDAIEKLVKNMNIICFRGNSSDVLDRYYQCAKKFFIRTILRVTADNPLIDPTVIDKLIQKFDSTGCDLATNLYPRTFPQGTSAEVFSFDILENAWKNAKKPSEREHITLYFYNYPEKFKITNLKYNENLSHLRWTVDRKVDLKLVRLISKKIKQRPILMQAIINLLNKEPNLIKINSDYILDEGYLKSLKEDDEFFNN